MPTAAILATRIILPPDIPILPINCLVQELFLMGLSAIEEQQPPNVDQFTVEDMILCQAIL